MARKRPANRINSYAYKKLCERLYFERDEQCEQCGGTYQLEFDHIVSRARGGGDSADNLQLLCRKCHSKKHGINFKDI